RRSWHALICRFPVAFGSRLMGTAHPHPQNSVSPRLPNPPRKYASSSLRPSLPVTVVERHEPAASDHGIVDLVRGLAPGGFAAEGQWLSHAEIEVAHGQHGRCQIGTFGIGAHPLEDRREEFGVQITLEADEAIGERRILPLRRLSVPMAKGARQQNGIADAYHRL